MQPGTKYCPNHPDLKFPPYKDECTVCNRTLDTSPGVPLQDAPTQGKPVVTEILRDQWQREVDAEEVSAQGNFPTSLGDHIFRTDEVDAQGKPEILETLEEPDPIEHATKTVEKLKASIKEKIEAKKAHHKGKK